MAEDPNFTYLRVIEGSDGFRVSLGDKQTQWLADGGHIKHVAKELWRSTGKTGLELHHLVMAQPELRDCDFCRAPGAPWSINCTSFTIQQGPTRGKVGGDDRPLFACEECAVLIEANEKHALLERGIEESLRWAADQGGPAAHVVRTFPKHALRSQIKPQVREVVWGMFANRRGRPTRN